MKGFRLLAQLALVSCTLTGAMAFPIARGGYQDRSVSDLLNDAFTAYSMRKSEDDNLRVEALCGRVLETLQRTTTLGAGQLEQLLTALELRGRVRLLLRNADGAKEDFGALLNRAPSHQFGSLTTSRVGAPSERFSQAFDDVRRETIGSVAFNITPDDAEVQFLGALVPVEYRSGGKPVNAPVGRHTVVVRRRMYEPREVTIDVPRGAPVPVNIDLPRVLSEVHIVTSVPGVAVAINNEPKGTTTAAVPAKYEKSQDVIELGPNRRALTIELPKGEWRARLTLECHHPVEFLISITEPSELAFGKVLRDASVPIEITGPGGTVWIDQVNTKQSLPYMEKLCPKDEPRIVEVRSTRGRDVRRFQPKGESIIFQAKPKPAIAILAQTSPQRKLSEDLGRILEEAMVQNGAEGLTFFRLGADVAEPALVAAGVKPGWLAWDMAGRRLSDTTLTNPQTVQRAVRTLSSQLGVQGVAEIHVKSPDSEPRAILLSYVADGSGVQDTIAINLDDQQSVKAAVDRVNSSFLMARVWSGVTVADVEGVDGAVVLRQVFDTTKGVTLAEGDVIVSADGVKLRDASAFERLVASKKRDETLTLQVQKKGAAGPPMPVPLTTFDFVQAVASIDKTQPLNKRLLEFRLAIDDPPSQLKAIARLNLAIMLIRAEDWQRAKEQLDLLGPKDLPNPRGIAFGTVQYYLGICFEGLKSLDDADRAYRSAAETEAWLTADGPLVAPLAKQRLAELRKR